MILEETGVKLVDFVDGKGLDYGTATIPSTFKKGGWNRLQADISGNNIKVYLNDKLLIDDASKNKGFYDGEFGLWAQRCKVQFANVKYSK